MQRASMHPKVHVGELGGNVGTLFIKYAPAFVQSPAEGHHSVWQMPLLRDE